MIDLHVHTSCSDGDRTPEQLIDLCVESGVEVVSITDHDTVSGVDRARKQGIEKGVRVIPGIEMSTVWQQREVHLVGLFVEEKHPQLLEYCRWAGNERDHRGRAMIARLRELGISITSQEEEDSCSSRARMGMLLIQKGVVSDMRSAFRQYLSREGKAYVDKERIPIENAIGVIHQAGGLAVLAHLSTISTHEDTLRKMVSQLKDRGLDGIECYYSEYSWNFSRFCQRLADELDLAKSGGSDFHGDSKRGLQLGRGYGGLNIPLSALRSLEQRKKQNDCT
ncbi:MAG: PHP domain-containing protein [Eubacteriales bacterium]|jgi:predicted metal-dependent phosphoesterase TrpH